MLELKQSATDKVVPFLMVSSANLTDNTRHCDGWIESRRIIEAGGENLCRQLSN